MESETTITVMFIIIWATFTFLMCQTVIGLIRVRKETKRLKKNRENLIKVDALLLKATMVTQEMKAKEAILSGDEFDKLEIKRREILSQALWIAMRDPNLDQDMKNIYMKFIELTPNMGLLPIDDDPKNEQEASH